MWMCECVCVCECVWMCMCMWMCCWHERTRGLCNVFLSATVGHLGSSAGFFTENLLRSQWAPLRHYHRGKTVAWIRANEQQTWLLQSTRCYLGFFVYPNWRIENDAKRRKRQHRCTPKCPFSKLRSIIVETGLRPCGSRGDPKMLARIHPRDAKLGLIP